MEELIQLREINIESILEGQADAEQEFFEKLVSAGSKINSYLAEKYQNHSDFEKEFISSIAKYKQLISETNENSLNAVKNMESKDLNQKRLDKEISNAINLKESLKAKIEKLKKERESLALEIIEKEKELEEKKEEKKKDWHAVKKACYIYKEKLDMRIRGDFLPDNQDIIVSFFYKKYDDKYCVHLSHRDTIWRVTKIEPTLNFEQEKKLSAVVNFSSDSKVSNITAFLCKIQKIFYKYYCA